MPLPPDTHKATEDGAAFFAMETKEELCTEETTHRLLMCMRMAKALEKGEIYLDATTSVMFWRLEKEGRTVNTFHSIDEMESYFEHLLENRWRLDGRNLRNMDQRVKRRMMVMNERHDARTNGRPMTFHSRIN